MANGLSHEARELELYAENTAELYPQLQAIEANLANKLADEKFVKDKAAKLAMYWVDNAAKRYVKEFGGGKWHELFPKADRMQVARRVVDSIETEYKAGNLDDKLTQAARKRREKRQMAKAALDAEELHRFAFGLIGAGEATRNKLFGPNSLMQKQFSLAFTMGDDLDESEVRKWARTAAEKARKYFGYGKIAPGAVDSLIKDVVSEYHETWREALATQVAKKSAIDKHAAVLGRVSKALDRAEKARSQQKGREALLAAEKAIRQIGGFDRQLKLFGRERGHGESYQLRTLKALNARFSDLRELNKRGQLGHPGKLSHKQSLRTRVQKAKSKAAKRTGPFASMADLKRANKAAGRYWFSRDTMKFFGTKIHGSIFAGRYFITSEYGSKIGKRGDRWFTIRRADDDASINTVGKLGQYASLADARAALQKLAGKSEAPQTKTKTKETKVEWVGTFRNNGDFIRATKEGMVNVKLVSSDGETKVVPVTSWLRVLADLKAQGWRKNSDKRYYGTFRSNGESIRATKKGAANVELKSSDGETKVVPLTSWMRVLGDLETQGWKKS